MSTQTPKEQKHAERREKIIKRSHTVEHIFRYILHLIERFVASVTLIVLIIALGIEIYTLIVDPSHLTDINEFLHHILTIVVGLEFVRMLIDTTPANILEVLTVAITRHVILSHDDYWSNLVCIACIGGLFAIRRYLIRRSELKEEMVEME